MLIGQLAALIVVAASLIGVYFFLKKKNKRIDIFLKVLSLVLAFLFINRFMLGEEAMRNSFALQSVVFESKFLNFVTLVLNWLLYGVIILVQLYPFFKSKRYATVIKYYGFIVTLLCVGFITVITKGVDGANVYNHFSIRALLMGFELGLLLAYCFVVFMENGKFKVTKDEAKGFAYIVIMLLATMPGYMLRGLFGNLPYDVQAKELMFPHRIILYLAFIIPFVLYIVLHKKDKETARGILLYISLGTLLSYSVGFKYADMASITGWPFHLCNTAMYILPLCLIFKWNKLFYFTYFINVFGALMAMLMPNYATSLNLFAPNLVNFYINHYMAFFMPILVVALKVYDRPKLKQFAYSLVGFAIYFVFVLILNAWFSNYAEVDYFFLNSDFIAEKLGRWAQNLLNITFSFDIGSLHFNFYPVYQLIFFCVYVFIAAGVWFIYEGAYTFTDTIYDMLDRKRKIKVDELALMVSRAEQGEVNMENRKSELVLENFTKRYGKSNVYAVKDANLEVHGGEVFGFLGHNGAGKSTIIKSIVGIQPITSGTIRVCGYDVEKEPVMTKKNIGFVPDHYALYEKLTGREYINYIADLYGVSQEDRDKALEKYVKLFELQGAFDNQIKTYSHGMKQKITIMSALVHNPKVWILDEPLTGLDPTSIYQVKECMRQHAKEGNIVFFSSHLIDVVEQVCTRVAIIKKGHILAVEDLKDIQKKTTLEQFYLDITSKKVDATAVEEEKAEEKAEKSKKKQKTESENEKIEEKPAKKSRKNKKVEA